LHHAPPAVDQLKTDGRQRKFCLVQSNVPENHTWQIAVGLLPLAPAKAQQGNHKCVQLDIIC
jgi:hypothetical protein